MKPIRLRTEAALLLAAALATPLARATEASAPVIEARQRFDRGLSLYNAGDAAGALAEFRRAHRLTGHPVVLYNLALVHAKLGQSKEAVEAFEKLDAAGTATLGPERAAHARRVHEEQLLRVGTLDVRCNVPRALIQLDGVDVARAPAPALRVTAGTHLVTLSAPGYEPRRVSVTIAGRAVERLDAELSPLEQAPARVRITSPLPDVEVRSQGQLLGRTPITGELGVKPGTLELEFTRDGYLPERRNVVLQAGSASELRVGLEPDARARAEQGALRLSISEPSSIVHVDGEPRLDVNELRLPRGRHTLRVERAGFFDVEREVLVVPGSATVVDVTLLPTPDYLDAYVRRARRERTWSYVALGTGSLVSIAGAGFLIWNRAEKADAERAFERYRDEVERDGCDADCPEILDILVDDLDAKRKRDTYGWVGLGVGAVALGTGVVLFTLGDDPSRYDPSDESDVFTAFELRASPRGLRLEGSF